MTLITMKRYNGCAEGTGGAKSLSAARGYVRDVQGRTFHCGQITIKNADNSICIVFYENGLGRVVLFAFAFADGIWWLGLV